MKSIGLKWPTLLLLFAGSSAGAQPQIQAPIQAEAQPLAQAQPQVQPQSQAHSQPQPVYQSYKSETSFFSEAPLEDIAASNDGGASVLNTASNDIVFVIPIRGFQFRKSLMQEHFNENYLESGKYPTATFKGKILGFDSSREGQQQVQAEGVLQIHGVERQMKANGTLEKKDGELILQSTFQVALKDYNITIPRLVIRNIAEVVDVSLEYYYRPKKID